MTVSTVHVDARPLSDLSDFISTLPLDRLWGLYDAAGAQLRSRDFRHGRSRRDIEAARDRLRAEIRRRPVPDVAAL
jgi:hypothetical protein